MDKFKSITIEEVKLMLRINEFDDILKNIKNYEFVIKSVANSMYDKAIFIYIKSKDKEKYKFYLIGIGEDEIKDIPPVTWKDGEKILKEELKQLQNKDFDYNENNVDILTIFDL